MSTMAASLATVIGEVLRAVAIDIAVTVTSSHEGAS